MQKFLDWLGANNPFSVGNSQLQSLSSGIVADEADGITCDSAEEVSASLHERRNEVCFYELSLRKSDKVRTFKTLQLESTSQKAKQKQSNDNIFHRMLLLAERSADVPSFFHYTVMAKSLETDVKNKKHDLRIQHSLLLIY